MKMGAKGFDCVSENKLHPFYGTNEVKLVPNQEFTKLLSLRMLNAPRLI